MFFQMKHNFKTHPKAEATTLLSYCRRTCQLDVASGFMPFQVNEFRVIAAGIMHYILYVSYKKTPYFDGKEAWPCNFK